MGFSVASVHLHNGYLILILFLVGSTQRLLILLIVMVITLWTLGDLLSISITITPM